jgi:hypothetical protein
MLSSGLLRAPAATRTAARFLGRTSGRWILEVVHFFFEKVLQNIGSSNKLYTASEVDEASQLQCHMKRSV